MSIGDTTENAILNLVFLATAWANYADNAAGTPQTSIALSLHTADPADAGTMSTSETVYSSYSRVSIIRTVAGWTTSAAGSTSPQANVDFPLSTGVTTASLTFFCTGKTGGGAAAILWSGSITPAISITGAGVTPRLTTASTITLD